MVALHAYYCSIILSIVSTQWSVSVATIVLTHWSGTVIIIVCSVVFCSTILSAVSTPWSGTVAALVFWVDLFNPLLIGMLSNRR